MATIYNNLCMHNINHISQWEMPHIFLLCLLTKCNLEKIKYIYFYLKIVIYINYIVYDIFMNGILV